MLKSRRSKADPQNKIELLKPFVGINNGRRLVQKFNCLNEIAKATDAELRKAAPKVTDKQIQLMRSAFHMGSEMVTEAQPEIYKITESEDVANLVREDFRFLKNEQMRVILVDSEWQVIDVELVAEGTRDRVSASPREIFSSAVEQQAAAIILAHNHPGGDPTPSDLDLEAMQVYVDAGKVLSITVFDSIIVGASTESRKTDYVSFRELGLMPE